jgi:AraC family transcriptional regulator
MPLEHALTVDYKNTDGIARILPTQPVTSRRSAWHGIEVQLHRQPPGEMPEHWTDQHILAIQPGQKSLLCERWLDGKKQVAKMETDNTAIIPANVTHRCTWNITAAATVLVLDPQYLANVAHESVKADRVELLPHFFQFDPVLQQIGGLLAREMQSDVSNCSIYVDSLTTALSAHLLRQYCTVEQKIKDYENGLSQYKLKQSIDYIQAHLTEDISLDDIAAQVGMSRYYFCQLFKRSTGMSPYQYVIKCRIDRAKELLLFRQDCSIADVAFQVGFASQSQFTKHFKKWVGTTPKKF